ncbi:hypothetical protein GGR13_001936 [Brevundimonas variabilis]|uniref:Uncharacterized protein n=1 Tax=Brevundimonas variabilis TaxID=74312 RepID=A0A7W9CIM1_9CAUL|nr:hypothetical protein [Brevundimonas variabilis]
MGTPARRDPNPQPVRTEAGDTKSSDIEPFEIGGRPRNHDRSNTRAFPTTIDARWEGPPPPTRWSRRRTLAFVIVVSGLLWTIIIAAIVGGIRLIAT